MYPLFGDAAGVTVVDLVEPDEGAPNFKPSIKFSVDGKHAEDLYMPGGGSKYPTTEETVKKGLHTLFMNSGVVKDKVIENMVAVTKRALAERWITD